MTVSPLQLSLIGENGAKKSGLNTLKMGKNAPQHNHFMFVETDDMDKLRALMQPVMGYWDIVITSVVDLK